MKAKRSVKGQGKARAAREMCLGRKVDWAWFDVSANTV